MKSKKKRVHDDETMFISNATCLAVPCLPACLPVRGVLWCMMQSKSQPMEKEEPKEIRS